MIIIVIVTITVIIMIIITTILIINDINHFPAHDELRYVRVKSCLSRAPSI